MDERGQRVILLSRFHELIWIALLWIFGVGVDPVVTQLIKQAMLASDPGFAASLDGLDLPANTASQSIEPVQRSSPAIHCSQALTSASDSIH